MAHLTLQQALTLAEQHRQGGRIVETRALIDQILQVAPELPEALQQLALLESDQGNLDRALDLTRRELARRPSNTETHNRLTTLLARRAHMHHELASAVDSLRVNFTEIAVLERVMTVALQQPSWYGFLYEAAEILVHSPVVMPMAFERLIPIFVGHGNITGAEGLIHRLTTIQPTPRNIALRAAFVQAFRDGSPFANAETPGPVLAYVDREYYRSAFYRLLGDSGQEAPCIAVIPFSGEAQRQAGMEPERAQRLYEGEGDALLADLRAYCPLGNRREEFGEREQGGIRYRPSEPDDVLMTSPVPLARPLNAGGGPVHVVCNFAEAAPRTANLTVNVLASSPGMLVPVPVMFRRDSTDDRTVDFVSELPRGTEHIALRFGVSGRQTANLPCRIEIDQDARFGAYLIGPAVKAPQDTILL